MTGQEVYLEHTDEVNNVGFGKELSSTKVPARRFGGKLVKFPLREMNFYGSKVVFGYSFSEGGRENITVYGFKQSMPHEPEYKAAIPFGEAIDINYIEAEKTRDEVVTEIRKAGYKGEIDVWSEYFAPSYPAVE